MRKRRMVHYSERPEDAVYFVTDNKVIVYFRENIQESQRPASGEDEEPVIEYTADEYVLELDKTANIEERFEQHKEEWRAFAKEQARQQAENEIRALRNKLLSDTDKDVMLDRLISEFPKGDNLTDFLPFLKNLISALTGSMMKYRQALRDVPQQEGFPWNVTWPEKPQ